VAGDDRNASEDHQYHHHHHHHHHQTTTTTTPTTITTTTTTENNTQPIAAAGTLLTVACCKHYAVYNTETIPIDRHHFDAVVGARDLWETYLPVFEACIGPAQGQSLMCSYNMVNGVPACANGGLLAEVARGTFNFSGFIMSDYDAWAEMVDTHKWAPDYAAAAVAGLAAGLDQEGGGGPVYGPVQLGIPAALAAGHLTLAQLEVPVRRLMRARLRLGMFDPPASNRYNYITHDAVASGTHLALAEKAAREGLTLLKNNAPAATTTTAAAASALPLALHALAGKTVAVVGPNANASYILLGSYSDPGCCTAGGIPTILQELSPRLAAAGVAVSYSPGCADANCASTDGFAAAAAAAAAADAVVIALGMGNAQYNCGGAKDRSDCEAEAWDRPSCALPGMQPQLVAAVRAAVRAGTPVVGVLVHGSSLCLDAATLAALDALLDGWYPGMRGGAAIADALVGAYSPAGRTPVTWYASDAALPADRGQMSPYPNASAGSPGLTYRFYDPDIGSGAPVVFSFGEGLSYTTFAASAVAGPAAVGPCDDVHLSAKVTNTGAVDSDVVVAVFLAQPDVTVPAPVTRLATFARVHVAAGQTVAVSLPPVSPATRAVIRADGGNATDVYSAEGKRWNEAGRLAFRVTLGEHNGDRAGGVAWNVQQTASRDIFTC
jgi:beta-glucosidase-like glycosyl hydrolase